jgi:large subunit ribosomal protein L30
MNAKTNEINETGAEQKKHVTVEKQPRLAKAKVVPAIHEEKPKAVKVAVKVTRPAKPQTTKPDVPRPRGKLALILIRGSVRMSKDIKSTLFALRLRRKHACVVIDDTPSNKWAAVKCKDFITYGEINEETYKLLVEKRGKKDEKGNPKKFFSLSSPKGGFERKGIKNPFTKGGALGYRGAKINDLIKKMI